MLYKIDPSYFYQIKNVNWTNALKLESKYLIREQIYCIKSAISSIKKAVNECTESFDNILYYFILFYIFLFDFTINFVLF